MLWSAARLGLPRRCLSYTATHEVLNQVPPLVSTNLFTSNKTLSSLVKSLVPPPLFQHLTEAGSAFGSPASYSHADAANAQPPVLQTHDLQGRRIDLVDYHPSYHALMQQGVESGATSLPFDNLGPSSERDGRHVARAALMYMLAQVDPGPVCPLVMTFAAFPAIESATSLPPDLKALLLEKLSQRYYDGRNLPMSEKTGITVGMSMTEKQGGSDVRANTTTATPTGRLGEHSLVGHKWFTSAPNSDCFLTLAKVDGKVSCFVVPRWLEDGWVGGEGGKSRFNEGLQFQRLKDKLGDKSNASSEVEYRGAIGYLLGEIGRGVPDIIEMVHHTRLECALGSAGAMQRALSLAVHHAKHRDAFGSALVDQPLMQLLLADLAVESKAATLMAIRLARGFEEEDDVFARVAVAASKYHVCKRQPAFAYECLEILGGNGYCETFPLARMFRASPLNSVWEGSGNVMALDVLRALGKGGGEVEARLAEEWGQGVEMVKAADAGVVRPAEAGMYLDRLGGRSGGGNYGGGGEAAARLPEGELRAIIDGL
ncbi:hypothetical protein TeGR_g5509 [Tetraparma gracilis]|uniref:Acyl-CoA dehydrogenase n=1 Tax=Tetraparma gracilis TaxID=2962635 RepID=A0ABQ6MH62_9STRA|nr:hypothetical protein TeGR_g5509 [Tetraparma gracilis]